jgi:hypothetical protein
MMAITHAKIGRSIKKRAMVVTFYGFPAELPAV